MRAWCGLLRRTKCQGCGQVFEYIWRGKAVGAARERYRNSPAFCSDACKAKHEAGSEAARLYGQGGQEALAKHRIYTEYLKRAGLGKR